MASILKKLALATAVVTAPLMAATGASADGEKYILVSHAPDSDSWWNTIKNGIALAGEQMGVEVEYRGLKQTVDKQKLRCRNSSRAYVELDWSIRAMAFAELIALREQIPDDNKRPTESEASYDTKHRSLANTMRAMRKCMRNLSKYAHPADDVLIQLSRALVQRYNNRTDKRARYRPKNLDKQPLGEPTVRILNSEQRRKLRRIPLKLAA